MALTAVVALAEAALGVEVLARKGYASSTPLLRRARAERALQNRTTMQTLAVSLSTLGCTSVSDSHRLPPAHVLDAASLAVSQSRSRSRASRAETAPRITGARERRRRSPTASGHAILRVMIAPAHRIQYTRADYLALERSSNVKHEYLDGQIYGMAGGTPEHAALAAAVIGILFGQLRGGRCRVHDSDLRVRVLETGLTTYPDVTVVCGPRELDPDDTDAVTNPSVIIEVLSKSTEGYDRGDKFEHYKRIPSLQHYVLVSHREPAIEVWTRDEDAGDSWRHERSAVGDTAKLTGAGALLDVRELYESAAPASA